MPRLPHASSERGSASAELIAVIPALVVAVLIAAQLVAVGYSLWSAGLGAPAGARAAHVGADPAAAARRALPPALRSGAAVREGEGGGGEVSVQVAVPRVLPALPPLEVGARTALAVSGG